MTDIVTCPIDVEEMLILSEQYRNFMVDIVQDDCEVNMLVMHFIDIPIKMLSFLGWVTQYTSVN